MSSPMALDKSIDERRTTLRTDRLDLTYGEITNMYAGGEVIISPEYQRLFRWTIGQQTAFIESLLLGFPVPPIFVAETEDGIWELVDGLQRVSTVLSFLGVVGLTHDEQPVKLSHSQRRPLLPELEGMSFDELSLRSKLSLKRAVCRVEILKLGGTPRMKYEVFHRLNRGGSVLTEQEVRNCIFRALDAPFMDWVSSLAEYDPFKAHLGLSEFQDQTMYDRGLVLRYFALKNDFETFKHDVEPFITDYTRAVLEHEVPFEMYQEEALFQETFTRIAQALEDDAWRHYTGGRHRGPFSVYVFDVISSGVAHNIRFVRTLSSKELATRCIQVKEHPTFKANIGPGANILSKFRARMQLGLQAFAGEA